MKKDQKIDFNKVPNKFVYNKEPYAMTLIGTSENIDGKSYWVINLNSDFIKNKINTSIDKVEDEAAKEYLKSKLKYFSRNGQIIPFVLRINDISTFNNIMKKYKVPVNIFPRESENKDVEFVANYKLLNYTKMLLNVKIKFKNLEVPLRTRSFLRGIPTGTIIGSPFDCSIVLTEEIFNSLLVSSAVEIGDQYVEKTTFKRG